jgi:hypothetical protein
MSAWSRAAAAAIVVALGAGAFAGCEGGSSDANAGTSDEVSVDASKSADQKVASALRRYLDQFRTGWMREGLHEYCDKNDSPERQRICEALRSNLDAMAKLTGIEVHDRVITLHTSLANTEAGRLGAAQLCGEIQGADVADFTPGHKVLGESGEVLLVCPARDEIDSSPKTVYFGVR